MTVIPLKQSEAHVWYIFCSDVGGPDILEQYRTLMSPEEEIRYQDFLHEERKLEHLISRALVRTVLSRYTDFLPKDLKFTQNRYGRPELSHPETTPKLKFNLSNCNGLIACVVAWDRDVGIDVEDITRNSPNLNLADQFLSNLEAQQLKSLEPHQQRQRFFEYWTLKESYIKARGLGLSLPLDLFSFHLGTDSQPKRDIAVSFDPLLGDHSFRWQFELFQPSEKHQMALALRLTEESQISIHYRQAVHLMESSKQA